MTPSLMTFDIFGTVIDWKRGLENACREAGRALGADEFDRIVDVQGRLEQARFQSYATIVARSLEEVIGLAGSVARRIGERVGEWPPFEDAPCLRDLMAMAPCATLTNSDRSHGVQVRRSLGFALDHWLCAEDVGRYKPDPELWREMGRRTGTALDARWWHVSAYADYDLAVADGLGLTTVLVRRSHGRPGAATHAVDDLRGLTRLVG